MTDPQGAFLLDDAPRRVPLRRSVALRVAMLAFVLIAAAAVQACAAAMVGAAQAAPLSAATLAALILGAIAYERRQPAVLEIGPHGVTALGRRGRVLFRGRFAGCAQWTHLLLVLIVAPAGRGRLKSLLLPGDALPAAAFRELAVLGRHGAR